LKQPSELALKEQAVEGPIVVFNVSSLRSDAFIITRQTIRSLRLPLLSLDDLQSHTARFVASTSNTDLNLYRKVKKDVKNILEWLWDVAVNPILIELGFTGNLSEQDVWPRICWVGSGLLNVLPIHAAGYHDLVPSRSALDCVISSYTPTIKALSYARERVVKALDKPQKALLISMPNTEDLSDLPFAEKEIEEVEKILSSHLVTTVQVYPTKASAVSGLEDQNIVHLACHGESSATDPSQSKLLLKDWKSRPLTVGDLTSMNLHSAQMAYMSACHTANTANLNLLDESIHLVSGIQLAGYPSVIGSLWTVRDMHSAGVAKSVYQSMLRNGSYLDPKRAAQGLHWAVRHLRETTRSRRSANQGQSDPLVWAPYVHFGI
jgi:hypothetical protein